MTRSAALTASQCATYGEVKKRWLALGITGDGLPAHLASSMLSGVATTLATNPVDMIKTQMYVSKGENTQITAIMTLRRVLAEHGASGLLRGFWANYARLGPQTVVTFVVAEQLRAQLGMNSL
jgi:solute carrier family 25 uncoupling protein 8/9